MFEKIKTSLRAFKKNIEILWCAYSHHETSLVIKCVLFLTIAYAVSPIDLIPDFIPIIGYLDDLLIIPFGIWLAWKLLPSAIISHCTIHPIPIPKIMSKIGIYMIIGLWVVIIGWGIIFVLS